MGLFSRLFGNKSSLDERPDRIWKTQRAKWHGIHQEFERRCEEGSAAVALISHFEDSLSLINTIVEDTSAGVPTFASLADGLTDHFTEDWKLDLSAVVDIIVVERHPTRSVDLKVLNVASELPCQCRVTHHLSLEDPLLKFMLGDGFQEIMSQLGLKDDEAIESRLVSKRIKTKQTEIEHLSQNHPESRSARAWIETNFPVPKQI
ncbi:MAG: hypothetical protein CMJ78_08720 [Planctomycetaceae bacterium]|nr:hypothetical protein [Planctomycetaceae bacterium]